MASNILQYASIEVCSTVVSPRKLVILSAIRRPPYKTTVAPNIYITIQLLRKTSNDSVTSKAQIPINFSHISFSRCKNMIYFCFALVEIPSKIT